MTFDNELKFKVLTIAGRFVEESMLYKGIYTTSKPTLHDYSTTIESLAQMWFISSQLSGAKHVSEEAIENLRKCSLTDFYLLENTHFHRMELALWLQWATFKSDGENSNSIAKSNIKETLDYIKL